MSGIGAIRLVTADAARLAAFYGDALGFAVEAAAAEPDPFGGTTRLRLRLGAQVVELVEMPGAAPAERVPANDARFQHFAMVAPDIGAAMARLRRARGWSAITEGGPQALPEASGGVTAFKLRDPEGHPLELPSFPEGAVPEPWREGGGGRAGAGFSASTTPRSSWPTARAAWPIARRRAGPARAGRSTSAPSRRASTVWPSPWSR